jgi:hypothetical protein
MAIIRVLCPLAIGPGKRSAAPARIATNRQDDGNLKISMHERGGGQKRDAIGVVLWG